MEFSSANANADTENQTFDQEDIVFHHNPAQKAALEYCVNDKGQLAFKFVTRVVPEPDATMLVDGVDTRIEDIDQGKIWLQGKWTYNNHLTYFDKLEQIRPLTEVESKNRKYISQRLVEINLKMMKERQQPTTEQ